MVRLAVQHGVNGVRGGAGSCPPKAYQIQVGLPASAAQDAKMNTWAEKHLKDEYSTVFSNCGDFVNHVLQAGDIKTFSHWYWPTIPNEMYDQLQQEPGAYIPDRYHQKNMNWNNYPAPVSSSSQ